MIQPNYRLIDAFRAESLLKNYNLLRQAKGLAGPYSKEIGTRLARQALEPLNLDKN